jgi:hypothetical protein
MLRETDCPGEAPCPECDGASSSRCSAAWRSRGRSLYALSSRLSGCGASACSPGGDEADPEYQARFAVLRQALQQLGWTEGYNHPVGAAATATLRADTRGNWSRLRRTSFCPWAAQMCAQCNKRPAPSIVFVNVPDPVGAGFVASLAHPAATPPASRRSNTACTRNCWSCSKRSLPA